MTSLKYGPYSPSRLEVANCPYSFFKQYVDPDRTKYKYESLPAARGSVVHEVFEPLTRLLISKVPRHAEQRLPISEEAINALIVDAVNRHPAAYQDINAIKYMVDMYLQRPPQVLTSDASVELRMAIALGAGGFHECGYDDPNAFARGRADIMMVADDLTTAIVYDHKTQPNIEDADTFQLGFYSWVIMRTYPYLNDVKTILHFARYGKYSEPCSWSRDDLMAIEDEIMTRVSIIESKTSWDAVPSKYCQYCPVIGNCPVMKELYDFDGQGNLVNKGTLDIFGGTTAQAVKMAQYLQVFEELTKRLKDELKEHVRNYGPVAIHGKRYDFTSDEKVDWDRVNKTLRNHAYEVFQKHGIDVRDHMGFSQTFSTGIWKRSSEELITELNFPKKVTTEFRGHKI